jgi:hypothetical protein
MRPEPTHNTVPRLPAHVLAMCAFMALARTLGQRANMLWLFHFQHRAAKFRPTVFKH